MARTSTASSPKPPAATRARSCHSAPTSTAGRTARTTTSSTSSAQFFAANGYAVLQVNYRGSPARGAAFQKAIFADWGNKEVVDLLGRRGRGHRAAASPIPTGSASAAGATAAS